MPRSGPQQPVRCADVHCHCLPGLDDGPASMAQALELCRALLADGITDVVATPHQLGRYEGLNRAPAVRQAVGALRESLAAASLPLNVMAGADVRLDERIPGLLEADQVLTLADRGTALLLEMPHETLIDLSPLIAALGTRGVQVILTHPERHRALRLRPQGLGRWLQMGMGLQVTAGSLLGDFGDSAEQAAWHWVRSHADVLVASDAHDTSARAPKMSAAFEAIAHRLGPDTARRVCLANPFALLTAQPTTAASTRPRTQDESHAA